MERTLNIIKRAVYEFNMEVDMRDELQDILDQAMNCIEDNVKYDYISVCEANRHYNHIIWEDGKGFEVEADGEFLSSDDSHNQYFRRENGEWKKIAWYDHEDGDYVAVYDTLDMDGRRALLVCK